MGAIKNFFKKLFNVFYLENFEEEFEEEKPIFILTPLFPSLETQEIALSVLGKTDKESNIEIIEEDLDEKDCTYTLSSIFPSPEIEKEVLDILEKLNTEKQEVSS